MIGIEWIGFSKLADQLGELLNKLRSEKNRRNNEASAYFEQLSAAMESVVGSLRENRVPRISGNEMNSLIHAFPEKARHVFSASETADTRALLTKAVETAETLDAYILEGASRKDSERDELFATLERITGHCKALAGILSKPA